MINHPSKASRLPAEIRDKIAALHQDGSSIDQIMAQLRLLDLPPETLPTRAGLGRYLQRLDRKSEELARANALTGALIAKLGKVPKSRWAQANFELMQTIVAAVAAAAVAQGEDGKHVTITPEQVYTLAKTLEALARAERIDLDKTVLRRKEREAKKAAQKAAKPKQAVEQGLSAETIYQIQTKIAGLQGLDPKHPLGGWGTEDG